MPTDDEILLFRVDADTAWDPRAVALCDAALAGCPRSRRKLAIRIARGYPA
jgi:hypothetical protein